MLAAFWDYVSMLTLANLVFSQNIKVLDFDLTMALDEKSKDYPQYYNSSAVECECIKQSLCFEIFHLNESRGSARGKVGGSGNTIHCLWTMNICTKFCANPLSRRRLQEWKLWAVGGTRGKIKRSSKWISFIICMPAHNWMEMIVVEPKGTNRQQTDIAIPRSMQLSWMEIGKPYCTLYFYIIL